MRQQPSADAGLTSISARTSSHDAPACHGSGFTSSRPASQRRNLVMSFACSRRLDCTSTSRRSARTTGQRRQSTSTHCSMSIVVADELLVVLGGRVAGTLTRLENARLHLEYDEAYRERPDATPLSLSMPIQVRAHADDRRRQTVTNYLRGLLPDNEAVLDRWARHYQVSASSAFALLGTPIGEDCAGAVAFCRAGDLERLLARPGTVNWLGEAEVAGRLRDLRRDATAWLGRRFTGQFSLAGAQAKTALLHRDGRWGQPSGAMATTHILKPAVSGFDDHDLNEHLCLDAARRANLLAARSWIATFEA